VIITSLINQDGCTVVKPLDYDGCILLFHISRLTCETGTPAAKPIGQGTMHDSGV